MKLCLVVVGLVVVRSTIGVPSLSWHSRPVSDVRCMKTSKCCSWLGATRMDLGCLLFSLGLALAGASAFLSKYLDGKDGVRAPPRLPPLTPPAPQALPAARTASRPQPLPPPPPPPLPPPSPPEPRLEAVRQVHPALRAWLFQHALGKDAGEALTSPLTFAYGLSAQTPTVHESALWGRRLQRATGRGRWTRSHPQHGASRRDRTTCL